MNKTLLIVLIFIALALAIYNVTLLNFDNLFEGDSLIACIGNYGFCLRHRYPSYFLYFKKIEKKVKEN